MVRWGWWQWWKMVWEWWKMRCGEVGIVALVEGVVWWGWWKWWKMVAMVEDGIGMVRIAAWGGNSES